MIYDMHCHVDLMKSMIEFCKSTQNENIKMLAVTTTPKAYEIEIETLGKFPNVYIALGLHPELVIDRFDELSIMKKYVDRTNFIGEIGLDYRRQNYRSKEQQLTAFKHIISWCQGSQPKVISIHSAHSVVDVLDVLEEYNCPRHNNCILHWYSGTKKQLERAIELGCYFSINEYMLSAKNGSELIQRIPVDRLLLESDAPLLSNITTAKRLKDSLLSCVRDLTVLKGTEMLPILTQTSNHILQNTLI